MKKSMIISTITLTILIIMGGLYFSLFKEQINLNEVSEEEYSQIDVLFRKYIPNELNDGLLLVEITNQETGSPDYRVVKTSKGDEQISVVDGYKLMYAYPNTNYFVKMHLEQSKPESYENDKVIAINELDFISKGITEVEKRELEGIEYYVLDNEDFVQGVISMVVIFFPEDNIITTLYFLNQKQRKFQTIDGYHSLKDNFIEQLILNK